MQFLRVCFQNAASANTIYCRNYQPEVSAWPKLPKCKNEKGIRFSYFTFENEKRKRNSFFVFRLQNLKTKNEKGISFSFANLKTKKEKTDPADH